MKTRNSTHEKSHEKSLRKKEVWYTKIKPPGLYSQTQKSLPRPSPISCDASTNTESTSTKLAPPSKDASTITTFDLPNQSTLLTIPANQPIACSSPTPAPALYQGDIRDYVSVTNITLNQLKRVEIVKSGEGVKIRNYIGRRNALRRLTDAEYIKLAICSNIDESKWSTTYCYTIQNSQ